MQFSYVIDAVVIIFGVYFLYITCMMKKKMQIPGVLLAEKEMSMVKDKTGFIQYLFVPMLLCAIGFILLGVFNLLLDLKGFSFPYDNYVSLVLFLVVFGFYLHKFRTAKAMYEVQ